MGIAGARISTKSEISRWQSKEKAKQARTPLLWNDRHLQTVCNELRLTVFNSRPFRVINDCLEPIRFAGIFMEPAWQTGRYSNADLRQDCTRIVFHFTLDVPRIVFRYRARHSTADSLTNHDPISRQRRFHETSILFRTEIWVPCTHFSDCRRSKIFIFRWLSLSTESWKSFLSGVFLGCAER